MEFFASEYLVTTLELTVALNHNKTLNDESFWMSCIKSCMSSSGEHLEKIIPMVVKFCTVEDDELRENCFQAFEAFVRK